MRVRLLVPNKKLLKSKWWRHKRFLVTSSVTSFDCKFESVWPNGTLQTFFCISFKLGRVKLRGSNQADKNLNLPIGNGGGNELLFLAIFTVMILLFQKSNFCGNFNIFLEVSKWLITNYFVNVTIQWKRYTGCLFYTSGQSEKLFLLRMTQGRTMSRMSACQNGLFMQS